MEVFNLTWYSVRLIFNEMKLQKLLIFFALASVTTTKPSRNWTFPSSNDVRIIPSNPCAKYFWNKVYFKLCLKKLDEKIKKRQNWFLQEIKTNKRIFLRFLISDLRSGTASSANISERTHWPWVSSFPSWSRTFCLN